MSYFEPINRKEWFEELARSTKIRALRSRDERVRATLLEVAKTYSQLAALEHNHCFCGREATCYKTYRGRNFGLCHLHAVAWEGGKPSPSSER
jgi:hypothetical protein